MYICKIVSTFYIFLKQFLSICFTLSDMYKKKFLRSYKEQEESDKGVCLNLVTKEKNVER